MTHSWPTLSSLADLDESEGDMQLRKRLIGGKGKAKLKRKSGDPLEKKTRMWAPVSQMADDEEDTKDMDDSVTDTPWKNLRVLFVHGLESGVNGTKAQVLKKHFTAMTPDLKVSAFNWRKPNSVARNVVNILLPYCLSYVLLVTVLHFTVFDTLPVAIQITIMTCAILAFPLCALFVFKSWILGSAIRKSLDGCTRIAHESIDDFQPDLVVGSSWGGAVLANLLKQGQWKGPSLLLCPAYSKVAAIIEGVMPAMNSGALKKMSCKRRALLFDATTDCCCLCGRFGQRLAAKRRQNVSKNWLDLQLDIFVSEESSSDSNESSDESSEQKYPEEAKAQKNAQKSVSSGVSAKKATGGSGKNDRRLLLVHGESDANVPLQHSRELVKWNPDVKLYISPRDNHSLTRMLQSGAFVQLIQAFYYNYDTFPLYTSM